MGALGEESTPLGSGPTVRVTLPDSEERHIQVRYEVDDAATPPGTLVSATIAPVAEGGWNPITGEPTIESALWTLADAEGRVVVKGFGAQGLWAPYNLPHVVDFRTTRRDGEVWAVDRVVRRDVYGASHELPTRPSDRGVAFDWTPKPDDELSVHHRLVRSVPPSRR